MHIVTVTSRKGGVGKTTLSCILAVEAERSGYGPVALIDSDPMRGLDMWWQSRKSESLGLISLDAGLASAVSVAERRGTKLLIIDTPTADIGSAVGTAVSAAHLVLIPVQPSPHDLRAIGSTVEICEKAGKPLVFIINRTKPRAGLTGAAAIKLSQYGRVAPTMIADRTAHASAAASGRTLPEMEPGGPAAVEAAELWAYVAERIGASA
jgi:chromosome partitioning protein